MPDDSRHVVKTTPQLPASPRGSHCGVLYNYRSGHALQPLVLRQRHRRLRRPCAPGGHQPGHQHQRPGRRPRPAPAGHPVLQHPAAGQPAAHPQAGPRALVRHPEPARPAHHHRRGTRKTGPRFGSPTAAAWARCSSASASASATDRPPSRRSASAPPGGSWMAVATWPLPAGGAMTHGLSCSRRDDAASWQAFRAKTFARSALPRCNVGCRASGT